MIKQQYQFCSNCNQIMPANSYKVNHILHALLSVLTIGFWIIIWALICLGTLDTNFYCVKCGNKTRLKPY